MKTSMILQFCLTVLFLAFASLSVNAQTTPDLLEGLTPYQSFHGGDVDLVNLSNGNLLLRIPLIDYPQRGGSLKLSFSLIENSKVATGGELCFGTSGCEYRWYNFQSHVGSVPTVFDQIADDQAASTVQTTFYLPKNTYEFARYAVVTSDGAMHPLSNVNGQDESTDATGFYANPSGTNELTQPTVVIDRNGNRFNQAETNGTFTREDPNGNQIIENLNNLTYVDTVGRTVPMPPNASITNFSACPSGGSLLPVVSASTWTVPSPNGGTATFTFCNATINVNIPANEPSPVRGVSFAETLTQSIVLPNGTAWSFEYNDRNPGDPSTVNFGIPTTVILPTGGTITYTYETIEPSSGLASWSRWVTSRTVNANDGTGPHTWNYAYANVGGTNPTTTITDPLGNNTIHTFALFESQDYFETETQYYQLVNGTQVLLKTVSTNYKSLNDGNIEYPIASVVPASVTTTWPNNQVSQTQTDYDTLADGGTASYGNITAKREYDYGTGAPGALLRTTTTQYEAFINSTYLTNNLLTRPSSIQITDGGGTQRAYTTYGYDEYALQASGLGAAQQLDTSPADGAQRGNQTSVHRWLNTNGSYLVSTAQYFDTGTVQTATDPKGNSTTFAYSATYEDAYPTTVTNALSQSTTHTYDSNTSLLASTTDPNNQPTSFTYDNMFRLATVSYPDNGSASITHQETTFPFTATLTKKINASQNYIMTNVFDGLGRVSQSELTSDAPSTTYSVTAYDALGRKATVYNPTRCNPPTTNCGESTWGHTTYAYDALSRITQVTQPDGSILQTSYTGSSTTVTDEAGKKRTSVTDGLGRLKTVFEDPSGSNYETDYQYDALDDMTNVTQVSSRQRTFVYDSLKRLTSASNPESGTVTYTYDADGNVVTKKDARGTTITYSWDQLNRLTEKSYSDSTPAAYFVYDVKIGWNVPQTNFIGRMTEAYTYPGGALVASIFSYDPLGRIVMNNQCDDNTCPSGTGYSLTYTYDLAGDPLTESNGYATNSYQYNSAMRPTTVTSSYVDATHPATLASGVTYVPPGQTGEMAYGNGLTGTYAYNNRLQQCRFDTNSSGTALGLCTDSTPSGSLLDLTDGYNWGSQDNGDLVTMSGTGQQTFSRSYTYDQVNRLATMSAPGDSCSGLSWGYDQWGNRTAQTTTGGTCSNSQLTFTAANQISNPGFTYDASGNVTHDANNSYFYDAENHIIQVNGTLGSCPTATACYVYDAFGRRNAKADVTGQFDYLYDLDGNVVSEWDNVSGYTGWGAFYVYLQSRLLTLYSNDTVYFVHSDHLNSTRLMTTLTKTKYDSMDYLPFGEQIVGGSGTTHKFTGKERDSESGLDNFGARYNSSSLGRFTSPDPINLTAKRIINPVNTLNKYIYGGNNPLLYVDPTGRDITVFYRAPSGAKSDAGHILLAVTNQATGQVRFADYYPKGTKGLTPVPGEMNQHETSDRLKQHAALTIQTNPDVAQKLIDAIDALSNNPPEFFIPFSDCADVCSDLLNMAGIDIPAYALSPTDVWSALYSNYSAEALQGGQLGLGMYRYQPGRDFGTNMSVFPNGTNPAFNLQLLYMIVDQGTLQPQKGCVTVVGPQGPITTCS